MEIVVSKSRLKPKLLAYLQHVEETGDELAITDRGRPVARIVPCRRTDADPLESLRHTVVRYDDPTEPAGVEDWEALRSCKAGKPEGCVPHGAAEPARERLFVSHATAPRGVLNPRRALRGGVA